MPNDVGSPDDTQEDPKWRSDFQGRLKKAIDFLQGDQPITLTQLRHIEAFADVLSADPLYRKKVENLTPIGFEILCIASTLKQAVRDAEFFVASKFEVNLPGGLVTPERRNEIRAAISNNYPYLKPIYDKIQTKESQAQDENRVNNAKEWITDTLSKDNIQRLVNMLVADSGPEEPEHVTLAISSLGLSPPSPLILNADQRTVLGVIHCAGGQVPRCFFTPAMVWTTLGESGLTTVTVPEVFDDDERREKALKFLIDHYLLLSNKEDDSIMVNPEISILLDQDVDRWRLTTLAVTCRAFPEWPHLTADPVRCRSLIPIISNVLSYLPRVSPSHKLQSNLMDMCISASYFGSLPWKGSMLKTASGLRTSDPVISHKLNMRTRMLYRLLRRDDTPLEIQNPRLHVNSPRSNAQFGEQIVLEMQALVDQKKSIEDIRKHFANFKPWNPESTQERQVSLRGEEIIIKAMRFQGDLKQAEERYVELMSQNRHGSMPARFMASYTELLCDLGDSKKALQFLDSEFDFRNKVVGRRLEMAVSQAHLTAGLWDFVWEKFDDNSRRSLEVAEASFRSTMASIKREGLPRLCQTNRGHYFVACAGLAMIEHISALNLIKKGDPPLVEKQLRTALQAWETAHAAHEDARASWSQQGYSEAVILLSKGQLLHHLKDPRAKELVDSARRQYIQTGQHFHVVAHGTVWPEILKRCPSMDFRGRVAFWDVVG